MANDQIDSADIDAMVTDLIAAGWVEERLHMWRDPRGPLWRGPAGAWKVMKCLENDRRLLNAAAAPAAEQE